MKTNPEHGHLELKHALQAKDEDIVNAFTTLRKVARDIKVKKRELKQLQKQWQELQAKIKPELEDPTIESE